MKILIPTYLDEVPKRMLGELKATISDEDRVFASCVKASASVNRNLCIDAAELELGEVAIMLDDDIHGFYPGWIRDLTMAFSDPKVVAVSARLMRADKTTFAETCSRCYAASPMEIEVFSDGKCVMPTAAIAFRNLGYRFDERFRGSGFEDTDWFWQYLVDGKKRKFIQSNRCRLVHRNEMKEQKGPNWEHNKNHLAKKWNLTQ